MERQTSLYSVKQISEINLTPLMDLTFILLITFIITLPMIEQGIMVNLPKGKTDDLQPQDRQTVTIDAEGVLFFNDRVLTSEAFASEMAALGATAPDSRVLVRADEGIDYGRVMGVLRVLKESNLTRMALVTRAD
jgi:biopolymer transport protein TolR